MTDADSWRVRQPRDVAGLRSLVAQLASMERLPTSPGEHAAARLLKRRFEATGHDARIELESGYGSYAAPIGLLCAVAALAGAAAGRRGRALGALAAAASALGIVDDVTGGLKVARRLFMRSGVASNVVVEAGDRESSWTLIVLAHHDAAPSGIIFNQRVHEWVADRHPHLLRRLRSNPPLWWLVIAGPALVAVGTVLGRAGMRRIGATLAAGSAAALWDISRRPSVPGANDNLSAVACLVGLAQALEHSPVHGMRVMLVSAGAEEALQEGISAFARRHFATLDRNRTFFLNLETLGSGRLILLEGEGPVLLHAYNARWKRFVEESAEVAGVRLIRGLWSRNSTDAVVPSRRGYPTATIASIDHRKLMPHYHLPSDTPEHLDWSSILAALDVAETVIRRLAAHQSAGLGPT